MADPVLHLLVGPNGAGKSTLFSHVIEPVTHLEFVNADHIAAERWPADAEARSYDAAVLAAERRTELIAQRASFAAETVFSHESKLDLVEAAAAAGFLVTLHVVVIPEALAVARVASRVQAGGHAVPEDKVRERFARLWPLVVRAIGRVDRTIVYDNSRAATPFRVVAELERGHHIRNPDWPSWTPAPLRQLG